MAELPEGFSSEIPLAAHSSRAGSLSATETEGSKSGIEKNAEHLPTASEPASESALVKLEDDIARRQIEAEAIKKEISATQQALNSARKKLDLPPDEGELVPSIVNQQRRLRVLKRELTALHETQRMLIERQQRECLLREEREHLLQEVISTLAQEFEVYQKNDPKNFALLIEEGTLLGGASYKSRAYGVIEPDILKSVLRAFRDGKQALCALLAAIPRFAEYFDALVAEEAERRVEERMAEICRMSSNLRGRI